MEQVLLNNKHVNHSLTQVSSGVYQVMSLSLQYVLLAEHSHTDILVASKLVSCYPLCCVNGLYGNVPAQFAA